MQNKIRVLGVSVFAAAIAFFLVWLFAFSGFSINANGQISIEERHIYNSDSWELTLVNADNPVPDSWKSEYVELSNGEKVDERIYPDLQKMFDDMRAQGVYPIVREGYRSRQRQEELLEAKTQEYEKEGYSHSNALKAAKETVAEPGTSEHELGLSVDINAADGYKNEDVYKWLEKNAYKYGFIMRYPSNKQSVTGIEYEPWHYRYVGKDAAKDMYESGACLEEYLSK